MGSTTYARRAAGLGAPAVETLRVAFGSWGAVCAHFGLAGAGDREAAAIAEVEAALEADARLREAWRDRGLEVCRVRPVRGGVAYELR